MIIHTCIMLHASLPSVSDVRRHSVLSDVQTGCAHDQWNHPQGNWPTKTGYHRSCRCVVCAARESTCLCTYNECTVVLCLYCTDMYTHSARGRGGLGSDHDSYYTPCLGHLSCM